MASFNRVMLMGNLTRDPELKYTPNQTAVTEVGLAVNEKSKDSAGNWIETCLFVDVTVWGKTAEAACQYLKKGSPVFFEGRLKLDSWEKDGKKNYKLRVVAEQMRMLGQRSDGGQQQGGNAGRPPPDESEHRPAPGRPPDDEIPFSLLWLAGLVTTFASIGMA